MFVSGYVYRLLRYEARQKGLRWTALMVLKDLQLLGPVSQRILCDIEQVAAPTMTVLIQEMKNRGWIRKSRARDARVSLVSITSKGQKELKRAGRLLRGRLEAELEQIPDAVFEDLESSLGVLSSELLKKIDG